MPDNLQPPLDSAIAPDAGPIDLGPLADFVLEELARRAAPAVPEVEDGQEVTVKCR
jgi:hypothetical protein